MAKNTVIYNCGCGFKTEALGVAIFHADAEGHTVEASGRIIGNKKAKVRLSPKPARVEVKDGISY